MNNELKQELVGKAISATCGVVVTLAIETVVPSLVKRTMKLGSKKRQQKINEAIENDGPVIVKNVEEKKSPLTVAEFKEQFNKEES